MWCFREYRTRPKELADLVTWHAMVADAPCVLRNKDGCYQTSLLFRGPDVGMLQPAERSVYLTRVHEVLRRLGTGWALWADLWHERTQGYPASLGASPTGWLVDAIRAVQLGAEERYEDFQVLTLLWRPPTTRQRKLFDDLLTQHRAVHQDDDARNLEQFLRQVTAWVGSLQMLVPGVSYATPEETCTYLRRCVSWDRHPVGCPEIPLYLDGQLATGTFVPGDTPLLEGKPLHVLGVRNWAQEVSWRIPTLLQSLAVPYRYTIRWLGLDKGDATGYLSREEGRWEGSYHNHLKVLLANILRLQMATENREAIAAGTSINSMREEVELDQVGMGWLTPTILVWGDTEDEATGRRVLLEKVIRDAGLILDHEQPRAVAAWLGSLPGDPYHNTRARCLSTLHLTYLLPQGTLWAGPERDAHLKAPPLLMASTAGTPFRVSLHYGEIGHGVLQGPSRSGKSAFAGLMASQFRARYAGARVVLFDKDYALKSVTLMEGGAHYTLGGQGSRGFHILGRVDEPDERLWAQGWLEDLLVGQGLEPTPDERDEMWVTLERMGALPPAQRTVTMYQTLLQVHRLKIGLQPFTQAGRYPYFDASSDAFALDNPWLCCEMSQVLATPDAVAPAMEYVWHRLEATFTGVPVFVLMDEPWAYFGHPVMQPRVADLLKAKAKKNVALWLCTQEIADLTRQEALWQAIQAQCQTWIYLPNEGALNEDVMPQYRKVGLTPAEIALIAHGTRKRDYLYKSPLGVRVFQCPLSEPERLLVAASTPDELRALAQLEAQVAAHALPAAWLRQHGYAEEAEAYEDFCVDRDRGSANHFDWRDHPPVGDPTVAGRPADRIQSGRGADAAVSRV